MGDIPRKMFTKSSIDIIEYFFVDVHKNIAMVCRENFEKIIFSFLSILGS